MAPSGDICGRGGGSRTKKKYRQSLQKKKKPSRKPSLHPPLGAGGSDIPPKAMACSRGCPRGSTANTRTWAWGRRWRRYCSRHDAWGRRPRDGPPPPHPHPRVGPVLKRADYFHVLVPWRPTSRGDRLQAGRVNAWGVELLASQVGQRT